jgi:hypothetical protein
MQDSLIEQTLGKLALGEAQAIHNLAVHPLLADADQAAGYLTLDQALNARLARVTEVSASGHVPELAFENLADEPVLLLDGEELVGAKQNRVLNVTLLVLGKTRLVIPVSCVEMGRWSHVSQEFGSEGRALYARARAAKMEQVSASLRRSGTRQSDQGAIWDDIAVKMRERGAASATHAMADVFDDAAVRLDDYARAVHPVERQVGAVFAIDGRVIGMELFDAHAAFAAYLPKLVKSYALDALDGRAQKAARVDADAAQEFLAQIVAAAQTRYAASGAGEDVRLEGEAIAGGALEHDGRLLHLAAYRVAPRSRSRDGGYSSPLVRASHRRRLH